MNTRRDHSAAVPHAAAVIVLLVLWLLLTSGCAAHKQYRTSLAVCTDTNAPDCRQAALERTTTYLLGFVEIDDQGWLWSRKQMDTVLAAVTNEMGPADGRGALILTFVHGWKNNAAYDNENVDEVRGTLKFLADLEAREAKTNGVVPRKIVGIYVGWRGLTLKWWAVKQTTFWGRKRTGHEVGRGALTELLLRLEALVNESKARAAEARRRPGSARTVASRLIIAAHSFGAGATYSALAPLYLERILVRHDADGGGVATHGFGDLVVLVNPAFEAARFHVLRDAARSPRTDGTTNDHLLNLAVFTSKGDTATKNWFPIGRFFTALFQSHQTNEQYRENITAVGHYKKFVTHALAPTTEGEKYRDTKAKSDWEQQAKYLQDVEQSHQTVRKRQKDFRSTAELRSALEKEMSFSMTKLTPRPGASPSPFIVAQVDKKLVPNHNDISRPRFTQFLREFISVFAAEPREEPEK